MKTNLALVIVLTFTVCKCFGNVYEWKNTTASEAVVLRPIPDGTEWVGLQKVNLWLCRIYADTGRWIPGKLFIYQDQSRCIVTSYSQILWSTDFQTLIAAPGTTSWIPLPPTGQIPNNAIEVGRIRDNRAAYACRAFYEDSLLVGGIAVNHTTCWMPSELGHKLIYSNIGWEILVVNEYGVSASKQMKN